MALTVTIIVLLILAGVSISTLTGNNGIINKAKEAKDQTEIAALIEEIRLAILDKQMENLGELKEEDLREILNKYFSDVPETLPAETEELQELELTAIEGEYKIKVGEIWNGKLEDTYKDPFSYTQADIDETLKYFTWDMITVTAENYEEYGYTQDMIGKTVAIITGTKENYYVYGAGYDQYFPVKKVVIPKTIDGSDYVDISSNAYLSINYTDIETAIFLNDYGKFKLEGCQSLKYVKFSHKDAIYDRVFDYCNSLEVLKIGANVTSIRENVFEGRTSLQVIVEAGSPLTTEDLVNAGLDESQVTFE